MKELSFSNPMANWVNGDKLKTKFYKLMFQINRFIPDIYDFV